MSAGAASAWDCVGCECSHEWLRHGAQYPDVAGARCPQCGGDFYDCAPIREAELQLRSRELEPRDGAAPSDECEPAAATAFAQRVLQAFPGAGEPVRSGG